MKKHVSFAVRVLLLVVTLGCFGAGAAQAAACTGVCDGGDGSPTFCRHHLFFGGICLDYGGQYCFEFECNVAIPNAGALDRQARSAFTPANGQLCTAPVEQASSPPSRVARVVVLETRL